MADWPEPDLEQSPSESPATGSAEPARAPATLPARSRQDHGGAGCAMLCLICAERACLGARNHSLTHWPYHCCAECAATTRSATPAAEPAPNYGPVRATAPAEAATAPADLPALSNYGIVRVGHAIEMILPERCLCCDVKIILTQPRPRMHMVYLHGGMMRIQNLPIEMTQESLTSALVILSRTVWQSLRDVGHTTGIEPDREQCSNAIREFLRRNLD
jgi:hypothetical protein